MVIELLTVVKHNINLIVCWHFVIYAGLVSEKYTACLPNQDLAYKICWHRLCLELEY